MSSDMLFSIEEVPVTPRKEPAGGCDLCQHCFLLRRAFLAKKRDENKLDHCTHDNHRVVASRENIHKE